MRNEGKHSETVFEYIEIISNKYSNSIAIIEEETNRRFTYHELMSKVSAIAAELRKHIQYPKEIVVGDETPLIGLFTNRSHASIASILGILKAGAAYVPIDPSFPEDRQLHILTHSKCQVVIVEEVHLDRLKTMATSTETFPKILILNASTSIIVPFNMDNSQYASQSPVRITKSSESLAYVLYTSGSTGKPKGVMVRNQGLLNIIQFFAKDLEVTNKDVILGLTTFCFDISMLEIFMPLISGATLALVSLSTQKNPIRILETLKKLNITIMQATPTTYEMLVSCGWNGDKNMKFLVGGEACRPKVSQLSSTCGAVYNVYGPTETTIWSSRFKIPTDKSIVNGYVTSGVPVGYPISATSFYLVSEKGEEVTALDGKGELFIGGDGVALGYLHAPDLTVARFIKNPFGPGRVYKTGDLFRRNPEDGTYTFLRRLDDQVKVAGFRIELAEVEFGISSHPDVKQAVVIVKDDNLVAFVVLNSNHHPSLDDPVELFKTITEHSKKSLPHYMVPKMVLKVNEFPQTANGKLDKLSLAGMIDDKNRIQNSILQFEIDGVDESSSLVHISEDHNHQECSMAAFLIQAIKKVNNQHASLYSTFAAVGVDSLAAVLFKNFLSQSLDGIQIDIGLLYDPDTTIASFAYILYDKVNSEKPRVLEKLHITCAVDKSLEDDIEANKGKRNTLNPDSVARVILYNRPLIDGYRGLAVLLILFQKLTIQRRSHGYIAVDEKLFVVITGFMIGLQEILAIETNKQIETSDLKFNAFGWLKSRAIGLFPLYWITIILHMPLILIYIAPTLSKIDLVQFMFLNISALNDWSKIWYNDLLLYYVSLIWNIFLIYASYKKILFSGMHIKLKLIGVLLVTIFLILMDRYTHRFRPNDIRVVFNPQWGFIYFSFGFIASLLFSYIYKSNKWKSITWVSAESEATESNQPLINGKYVHESSELHKTFVRHISNYLSHKNIMCLLTDALAFLLLFLIFKSPGYNGDPHNRLACLMVYGVLPFLFLLLLIISFLQPTSEKIQYSLFTIVMKTPVFVTLGQCSLAIYMYRRIVTEFYFNFGIIAVENSYYGNPFTENFRKLYRPGMSPRYLDGYYCLLSFIIAISFGIFMQRVIQERVVPIILRNVEDLYNRYIKSNRARI